MKIQLDTFQKTIKIEQAVKLGEFFTLLESLLPKDAWKDFTLEINTILNWSSPIIFERYSNPFWTYPWSITTCGTADAGNSLLSGTYNIEVKNETKE